MAKKAVDKNRVVDAPTRAELAERMGAVRLSRYAELPKIELYLDQVLAIVNEELGFMRLPGEVILTGSMVNNYVKQRLVPAPERKRYGREHVASLVFVCVLKRALSISQVAELREGLVAEGHFDAETYDRMLDVFECDLVTVFGSDAPADAAPAAPGAAAPDSAPAAPGAAAAAPAPTLADEGAMRLLRIAVEVVANKTYVEQSLSASD